MLCKGLWRAIASVPRRRAPSVTIPLGPPANANRRSISQVAAHRTYICHIDAEPLHRYRPGGYHPVHLGDLLQNGRYMILHKVGWGGYSTTWAARDKMEDRYVAVKVSVSESGRNHEAEMLQIISALPADHPGRAHLVQMLDHFTVTGPNGTHNCLVLELLGPNVPDVIESFFRDERLPATFSKSAARQVLLGMDFLAQHKIGHGDLHSRNLAFVIPHLDSSNEQQFFETFGKPETAFVSRIDGVELENNIPSYVVRPISCSIAVYKILHSFPMVKIIDFGESFVWDNAPTTLHTPLVVRAPEVVFGDQIDYRVDLWSMGCLLFELVTGQPPFDSAMLDTVTLISQMMEFATDKMPDRWQEKWDAMGKTAPNDDATYTLQGWLEEVYFDEDRCAEYTKQDITKICELVGRMLKFEPSYRAEARDILDDPWFTC